MKRALVVAMAGAVVAAVTGCAAVRTHVAAPAGVAIAADLPPSPTTWPKYPHFAQHSCWVKKFVGGGTLAQAAPSYVPPTLPHPVAPAMVARRLLAGLGDRRYVRSIKLTPSPPAVGRRHAGGSPPADALQAEIVLREAKLVRQPSPERSLKLGIAQYEGAIVGDALRDDVCDAGGAPLVRWTAGGGVGGAAVSGFAFGQRYPNPSPTAYRKRVARVGRRFGFTVASLRLLRPRQIAPLLIVRTRRPRKAFIADIRKIMELLNPSSHSRNQTADTFEAFFFAAEDARGPFVSTDFTTRAQVSGGEWVVRGCPYPYGVNGDVGPVGPCS